MLKNTKSKYDYNKNNKYIKKQEESLNTEFVEKVLKFIKYDDLIKKEKEEFKNTITALEDEKHKLEEYLIKYLQLKDKDIINTETDIIKIIERKNKKLSSSSSSSSTSSSNSTKSEFKLQRKKI